MITMRCGVDVADAQVAGFTDAQPGAVGAEQQRAVHGRLQFREHCGDLRRARDVEQLQWHLRKPHPRHHLRAVQGDREQELDRRDVDLQVRRAKVQVLDEVQQIRRTSSAPSWSGDIR